MEVINIFIQKWRISIRDVIKDKSTSLYYTATSGFTSVAQLVSSFIIIKYIDPSDFGIWKSIQILTVYSFIFLFGINNGLNRELPFLLGNNKLILAKDSVGVALFINLVTSTIIFIVGIIWVIAISNNISNKLLFGLLIIIPYIIINHYNNYLHVTYRSSDSFSKLSNIKVVESVLMILSVLLVVYYGYKGMLLRALGMLLIVTLCMHVYRPEIVKPVWNKDILISLYKTGIPIFLIDYIKNISSTIAPLIVLKKSGFEMVGLLSLGAMAFTTICVIPTSINQYAYPKYSYSFGKFNKSIYLWKSGLRYLILCFIILLPVVIISLISVNYFVLKYFPKYSGGVPAAKIFILASLFDSIGIMSSILVSLKCFKLFFIQQIIFSIMLIILPLIFVNIFLNSTVGASFGILLANIMNFALGMYIVYIATHNIEIY